MSVIADLIRAGVDPDLIAKVADEMGEARARGALEAAPKRSAGADRTARYRARKASQTVTERHDVTEVTLVTGDDEAEKEKAPQTPKKENPLPKENPPKGGQKKGVRLPEGWRPSQVDFDEACRCIGRQRTESEVAKFRDYWIGVPGEKGRKLDWDGTFRNWIRRLAENFGKGGPAPLFDGKPAVTAGPEPLTDDQIRRYLRGHAETEYWPGIGPIRERLGPPPGWTGCRIPAHLLAEYERMKAEAA